MATEPVYPAHPDTITLRQAEALTGINYQTIHDAAIAGHIHWAHYDTVPTFRVSKRETLTWAANQVK